MRKVWLIALLFLLPSATHASTALSARTLVLSEPVNGNAYLAATDVTIAAPQKGDVLAAGATISTTGAVGGDLMLAGGTVALHGSVAGDARVVGWHLDVSSPVGGDVFLAGATINASTTASYAHIVGGSVNLIGTFTGPVKVYGGDVTLSGTYAGDVTIAASDHIEILPGTVIKGKLSYNAPEQITLPEDASVLGGVTYTGSSSFLPTNEQAKRFAVAGASILFLVHLAALLVLAGLGAGLFPEFTERMVERSLTGSTSRFVLLVLLGFAVLIATPVLVTLLMLSFVGIGVSLFVLLAYLLALATAYVYAGILAGTYLARKLLGRSSVTWKEAVGGMFVFYLIGAVPVLGNLVKAMLVLTALGALVSISYAFAFKRHEEEYE